MNHTGDECDCAYPPPSPEAEGSFAVSNTCPIHSDPHSPFYEARWGVGTLSPTDLSDYKILCEQ